MSILRKKYTAEELLNCWLPKWPQMLVTGDSIATDQALEIIRRTDTFFTRDQYGNSHGFNKMLRKLLHMPEDSNDDCFHIDYYHSQLNTWQNNWGCILAARDYLYTRNSWVSCNFPSGPNGWCHPDGNIGYNLNIGKSPSCKEVFEEWTIIAQTFPFLTNIGVTLMDSEMTIGGEKKEQASPVISFFIHEGVVKIVDPHNNDVHEGHDDVPRYKRDKELIKYRDKEWEQGLTDEQIDVFVAKANILFKGPKP